MRVQGRGGSFQHAGMSIHGGGGACWHQHAGMLTSHALPFPSNNQEEDNLSLSLNTRVHACDREHETEKLDSVLTCQPTSIRVVLGPPNCGKTATLVSYLQGKKNIVYIDCRGIDTSSPTAFLEVRLPCLLLFMLSWWACFVVVHCPWCPKQGDTFPFF